MSARKRERGHRGQGTIYQRKDGRFEGQITLPGRTAEGNRKRITVYGTSREQVVQKLQALNAQKATLPEPSRITLEQFLTR